MNDLRTPVAGTSRAERFRELVVRFAHIDAAGIVFYPRYLEMLAQAFPELTPTGGPFTLEVGFRKPTPLGTRLTLAANASTPRQGWRVSGTAGGEERFTLTFKPGNDVALTLQDHEPDRPAFHSEPLRIENWAAGPDALLQISRYYEFVNAAVEQWFESELELPFSRLNGDRAGIPTVSLRTVCAELPRRGETISVWLRPTRIGHSSVQFDSWLVGPRGCVTRTSQSIVFVRLEQHGFHSAPLPEGLRARLFRHLAETAPN